MECCNLVHDGDSIMAALKALVELGSDGGIGKGRIWFLLDNGTKRGGNYAQVHDGDSIMAALKALVELGSDGGIGKGRIWFLLDNGTKRAMELCPDDNTIAEQIGTTREKMQSAFGRFWKTKLQAGQLGVGFHAWQMNSGVYVTVGASASMDGVTPELGYIIERGSPEADTIKAAIHSKLREEVGDKDNTTPSPSKDSPSVPQDIHSPKNYAQKELDLPAATPSPKQTEMSNSNKRKALSDKSLDDTEEGSPDNTDKVIDDTKNDISDRLLVELEKQLSKLSSMPDIRLQSFSQSILARCLARSTASNGVIKLSSVDERNHVLSNTYMKMPSCRVCNPSSTKESKKRFLGIGVAERVGGDELIGFAEDLVEAEGELGSDGGIGKGRIWFLLDNGTKRARELCPDDNTIAEQIGTTREKMQLAFGRNWKTKLQAGKLGGGFHAW
eukprot:CAMPEP_0172328998 /NCGR_PEP_ID=MMETSP1058-20130122/60643_1 /TAXON_ID=83371 /ORGANISM="Detonula confervacea, Strain CCMP 353" /LENGTH=442 /DNA_ID=CAMNT_0013046143 /DNA_START=184 /DNA_END=1511 /DNA_ORIENTATION=-